MARRMMKYYNLTQNDDSASVEIFGDITSDNFYDDGFSVKKLSESLKDINAKEIHVSINSYGGEVAEGLAIYNALKNHPATVITECVGFACSIASVIFMAGDVRIMDKSSLLMIHNPWTCAMGNSEDMRKAADDLDTIGSVTRQIYVDNTALMADEIQELLDNETWITPENALEMGFCTAICEETETESKRPSQCAKRKVFELLSKELMIKEKREPPSTEKSVVEEVVVEKQNVFKKLFNVR